MARLILPRRTFLRGAGGLAIGLPLLDIMLGEHGDAMAGGGSIPSRFLLCFGGFSLGTDAGPSVNNVVPPEVGPGYTLGPAVAPLNDAYGDLRDEITIVSGLSIPSQTSFGGEIPPGGRGVNFHAHTNPLFTGNASLMPAMGESHDYQVTGVTADQIVADANAGDTTFTSLQYRAQALLYHSGAYAFFRNLMSWRLDDQGEPEPLYPVASPRQAFDSLFLGFVPDDRREAIAKALEIEKRKSILDLVDRRMEGMVDKLGGADKAKLEEHLDAIREIEMLLNSTPPDVSGECQLLADPGEDPALGGDFNGDGGAGVYDANAGYSDEDARARVFADLVHMAFVCDLTRSATLMYTMMQSFMNVVQFSGHEYQLHDMTHTGTPGEFNDVIAWHMEQFAYLVAKLRDTPEADGSLLDHCAVGFFNEAGGGFSYENGAAYSSHSTDGMAMLVAGGAGGLLRGEHLVAPAGSEHTANVLISLMEAVGVSSDLGDVSGTVPGLLT
ncbi:MAG: DUF1552 domain-containing protein [Myxococcota bacterium]